MPGVTGQVVGGSDEHELLAQVQDFTSRASEAFGRDFPPGSKAVTLLGCEWSSVPVLSLLQATGGPDALLSIRSLERQRSDLNTDLSREIEAIERAGLAEANTVFWQEPAVARAVQELWPDCAGKLVSGSPDFPVDQFENLQDPGAIKGRYQVGPVDPTILYVGDLDERHAADVLVKSMPTVLRNHKQARLVIVGDGELLWPLKVYARYLLIEHAVRLVGHMEGRPLAELIQAADVVAVPSRVQTEWWPIQAAWAAGRPVVASHEMAAGLALENEKDAVLVYPHESSCVWGIERVLFDEELRRTMGSRGREKVEKRFGWSTVAGRIEQAMGARAVAVQS
jgi:glycosyltransferase involved in cell wall biosynthesis